jgi:hypothetical protein
VLDVNEHIARHTRFEGEGFLRQIPRNPKVAYALADSAMPLFLQRHPFRTVLAGARRNATQ